MFLLDDPLAAVDAHVAKHLVEQCIMGLLDGKTRVLCTHHTKYLKDADIVIVMDDGKIKATGTPAEILSSEDMLEIHQTTSERRGSKTSEMDEIAGESPILTGDGSLVAEEEKDTGVVKGHVYKSYWTAVGSCLSSLVLLALFLMQGKYVTLKTSHECSLILMSA